MQTKIIMAEIIFHDNAGNEVDDLKLPTASDEFKVTEVKVGMLADDASTTPTINLDKDSEITINVDHQASTPKALFVEFAWKTENFDDVAFDCQVNFDDRGGTDDVTKTENNIPIDPSKTASPAEYSQLLRVELAPDTDTGKTKLRSGKTYQVTALFFLRDKRTTTDRRVLGGTLDLGTVNVF